MLVPKRRGNAALFLSPQKKPHWEAGSCSSRGGLPSISVGPQTSGAASAARKVTVSGVFYGCLQLHVHVQKFHAQQKIRCTTHRIPLTVLHHPVLPVRKFAPATNPQRRSLSNKIDELD